MGIRRGTRGASRETGPKNIFSRVSERTSIDRDKRIGGKGITGQIGKKSVDDTLVTRVVGGDAVRCRGRGVGGAGDRRRRPSNARMDQ